MKTDFGNKIAKQMAAGTMDWFDVEPAKLTANQCLKVVQKLVGAMLNDSMKKTGFKDKGQTGAYLVKMLDILGRFIQFSQGAVESRKEVTVADLLPHLSQDELAIFDRALVRWEEMAAAGASNKSPNGLEYQ